MLVYCKRTFFNDNKKSPFLKGKTYLSETPKDYQSELGIYLNIKADGDFLYTPITQKNFKKYFMKLDELRNNRIDEIFN